MILGIGIDIFEISRLERMLERDGEDFLREIFSPSEIEFGSRQGASGQFFGRSFAAKEAVIKAIGSPELRGSYWHNIEITEGDAVQFTGFVRDLVQNRGIQSMELRVRGTGALAIAIAVARG